MKKITNSRRLFNAMTKLFLFSLLLTGCNKPGPDSSTDPDDSRISENGGNTEKGDLLTPEEYEESITGAPWTKTNHLYIHYLRKDANSYPEWDLWVWQKVPRDLEGHAIDYFMQDQSGVIFAVDLNHPDLKGVTKLGFLLVLKESKNQSTGMWVSDASANVYIPDIPTHVRPDGTIHIFCTEGNSLLYTFFYEGEEAEDPFEGDTGQLESKTNVNSSSTSPYPIAKTSPDFASNAGIGYQIQVATFADSDGDGLGDINGITAKLDYIESLNVNAIWLTPIQECESYHGYDTIDYYAIDSRFGTLNDYRRLIYEAHKRDIRVVMDLVLNHTSKNNLWFTRSAQVKTGKDLNGNPVSYRDLYHWKYSTTPLKEPWYRFGTTDYYYYAKFSSGMPELNYDNQTTRDFMVDVAKYWLGFGVDGFRIDAVKHIYMKDEVSKNSSDVVTDIDDKTGVDYSSDRGKNINFFREFNARVKSVYPNAFIVGENFDGWDERISPYLQGMDALLDFPSYYHFVNNTFWSMENSANVEGTSIIPNKLSMYNSRRSNGKAILSAFTSNHDVERALNHANNKLTGSGSFSTEHHTPITATDIATKNKRAQVYIGSLLLQPGLTWIYYGDEIGMSGNITPNNSENAPSEAIGKDWNEDRFYRQPMKWVETGATDKDMMTNVTFSGYTIPLDDYNKNTLESVKEQQENSSSFLKKIQELSAFKGNSEYKDVFLKGNYSGINSNENVMAWRMSYGGTTLQIYCNFSASQVTLTGVPTNVIYKSNTGLSNNTVDGYGIVIYKQ
ncbi:MAG: alpha-amylase family glycosyl hydrolase [Bacilli bacterium]|jgi:glycosidase